MNEWDYTSTPSVGLQGMERDNFTFMCIWLASARSCEIEEVL